MSTRTSRDAVPTKTELNQMKVVQLREKAKSLWNHEYGESS